MMIRFGLWLARLGGWEMPRPAQHIEELAALRQAFEGVFRANDAARREAEALARTAIADREQAAGALRAFTAPVAPLLFHRAKELTAKFAGNHGISGEAKRHQVYATLRKEFGEPHRDIGLAIELALR